MCSGYYFYTRCDRYCQGAPHRSSAFGSSGHIGLKLRLHDSYQHSSECGRICQRLYLDATNDACRMASEYLRCTVYFGSGLFYASIALLYVLRQVFPQSSMDFPFEQVAVIICLFNQVFNILPFHMVDLNGIQCLQRLHEHLQIMPVADVVG